jgi:MFS family permease
LRDGVKEGACRPDAGGGTVSYPIQAALMSDFYPPSVWMRAMGLFTMAGLVGDAIGPLLGAGIAAFFGWRGAFVFIGLLTYPRSSSSRGSARYSRAGSSRA